jgi:hypothetical protein
MKNLIILVTVLGLVGCTPAKILKGEVESIKPRNAIKTAATTVVAYTIAGPVPAALNLASSVLVDEVLPPAEPDVPEIDPGNKEQMWAYIWKETQEMILYGFIAFLLVTTIVAPWAVQRRARRKRKYDQYRYEALAAREKV